MIDPLTYFIYIGLLLTVTGLTYSGSLKESDPFLVDSYPQKINAYQILTVVFISLIAGLRYEVGTDWDIYTNWFEFVRDTPHLTYHEQVMEWGYFKLNKFIVAIGGSYSLVFFLVAFISWFFIVQSVPLTLLPLVLFFLFADGYFFWSMNGIRQFAAVGIFIYSLKFVIEKNLTKYLGLIALASLFHFSILLLIPLYFIPFKKLYHRGIWLILFLISFLLTNSSILFTGIETLVQFLSNYVPFIESEYSYYLQSKYFEATGTSGSGLGDLYRTLVTFLIIIYSKEVLESSPQYKIYFILYFMAAIISNLFFSVQIIGRFNTYFLILRSVVLAMVVYYLWKSNKSRKILAAGIVALYFFLYLVTVYNSANMNNPYQFSFFQ